MNIQASQMTSGCPRSARLLAHRPLVSRIARRISGRLPANVEMDDLIQAGMIGLDAALTHFEEGRGASFDTYAARRIEGAMLDTLRATDTLSRDLRANVRLVRSAVQRLEHALGRAPRAKEVANELGWTLQAFHDCMVAAGASGARCGDEQLEAGDDESADDEALSAIDAHADPVRSLEQRQRHAALHSAFDALEERERRLMEMIYDRGISHRDAGAALGVSPSRVTQMHEEIVVKLRRRLRDW
ncbi:sigma-70 family RNA polymerase sigma factor [Piscinibacter sp.]|uniref:sigma-70 family RNA polymerase sigma factor n=1 Tax=Piscinibacter sp. TaxID=1903157 RepID=UPI002F3E9B27